MCRKQTHQALALLFREKDVKIGIYFGVFFYFHGIAGNAMKASRAVKRKREEGRNK